MLPLFVSPLEVAPFFFLCLGAGGGGGGPDSIRFWCWTQESLGQSWGRPPGHV